MNVRLASNIPASARDHELVDRVVGSGSGSTESDRQGGMTRCCLVVDGDLLVDLVDHRNRPTGVDIVEHHCELVTAETGDDVGGTHRSGDRSGRSADQCVAVAVAELIVDQLQIVHVGEDHRDGFGAAPAERHEAFSSGHERPAVREPGE